jgi:hypothetical protein
MSFLTIKPPRERDQAIMEIILSQNLAFTDITRINRCRVYLQALFLLDITTADRKYLKRFIFDPGGVTTQSGYMFPREQPSRQDLDRWINFWHEYTTLGGKLKTPLGGWINPTHRIWHWYYNKERDKLYHISGTTIKSFKQASGWQCNRLTTTYQITHVETSAQIFPTGIPTSIIQISESRMNKLQEGPLPPPTTENSTPFWVFIDTWGGNWMWRNIDTRDKPKGDMQWVADGMTAGTLIWTTDGSYGRKRAADLLGKGLDNNLQGNRLTNHWIILGMLNNS